jgi:ParB family chromosome partitioning protein
MPVQKRPPRADKLKNISLDRLERGRFQPRRAIDGIALKALTKSVHAQGIIQPLLVRKVRGKFEIIAGERRWHAARTAGLKKVPAVVRNVSDAAALALALVENLHREDLNPIDQAYAIRQLIQDFSMTHQEVADAIGRSRTTVTNLLRLLDLPPEVRAMLTDGKLDAGHARALLALEENRRTAAAEQVVASKMSVRNVERMVTRRAGTVGQARRAPADEGLGWLPGWLEQRAGDGIRVKPEHGNGWSLNIAFSDLEGLRGALRTLDDLLRNLEQSQPSLRQQAS